MDTEKRKNELDKLLEEYIEHLTQKVQSINPQSVSRKHHYIPRFYLERFASPRTKMITIYDKQNGKVFEQASTSTGYEKDFYIVGDREKEDWHIMAEIFWSLIESDVSGAYLKILNGELLEPQERVVFSLFIASMICRSRSAIRVSQEMAGGAVDHFLKWLASDEKRFDKVFGDLPAPPAILGESSREVILEGKIKAMGNHNFSSPAAPSATIDLSQYIVHMAWSICKPARQLVTSDTPAIPFSAHSLLFEGGKIGGVAPSDSQIFFPLTPDRVFIGDWGNEIDTIGFVDLPSEQTRSVNNLVVSAADRFVYVSKADKALLRFIENRRNRKIIHRTDNIDYGDGQLLVGGQFIENFKK